MKRILLIEDEQDFANLVISFLKKNNFRTSHASTGKEALQNIATIQFSLIILDLGLPDTDGLKLCAKIRKSKETPILILTARDDISDKVTGFNVGADDYLVKPVSLKELLIRIERLLTRDVKGKYRTSVFKFGNIQFNTVEGTLKSKKNKVSLTKKEKALLEYLVLRKGQVLTRMEIMDNVWGSDIDIFSNTVNMTIVSLRRKITQVTDRPLIHSVHALGYKFQFSKK